MNEIRTRFAPSPTGYMHIGNLRTALYSYLIAKHANGKFILRIEDTDQKRYTKDAIDIIYKTLKKSNIICDEGPLEGGNFGPYIQSERKDIYLKYAKQLVEQGDAYYCFCKDCHSDLERYMTNIVHYGLKEGTKDTLGYDGHCRHLSKEEIEQNLKDGKPYVIRQKIPNNIDIHYKDMVFGKISINSSILDDQVLIKQDGFPTYNFANVIDDHLMEITHIVRGCEYLSSTPKYILLYKAFNWDIPKFIHLPIINGKDENGNIEKLSKRHGSTSFEDLIKEGYLSDAIINYIMFLGWNPKNNQEIFSLPQLINFFEISQLNKSAAIFDYKKLEWFNAIYIRNMSNNDFENYGKLFLKDKINLLDWKRISKLVKQKITKFTDLYTKLDFLISLNEFPLELFFKSKYNLEKNDMINFINYYIDKISKDLFINIDISKDYITEYSDFMKIPFGFLMWVLRIALTGLQNSILGGLETAEILGKDEVIKRLKFSLELLQK